MELDKGVLRATPRRNAARSKFGNVLKNHEGWMGGGGGGFRG